MKRKKIEQIAQGDVLLVPVVSIPSNAKKLENRTVIAYGEATGHAHRFAVKLSSDVEMYEADGVLYVRVNTPTPLKHEEHDVWKTPAGKTITQPTIEPGTYRYAPQRVWDPWMEEARRVQD